MKGRCTEEFWAQYDNKKESWRILTNKETYAMVKKTTIADYKAK